MNNDHRSGILPPSALRLSTTIAPIGTSTARKTPIGAAFDQRAIALTQQERENHTHIIGSTGTGKSKFIELLLRKDIENRNCGLCLIDPHGSLYEEVLSYVAQVRPSLADRFVLFNPAGEYEQIVGFNPIPANITHFDYTLSTLISACLKAWGQDSTDSTPRISRWLRNIFYPILAKRLTLLESAPLVDVYSRSEREALLAHVENSVVMGDWLMFEKLPLAHQQQQIEGAANRLQKFLSNGIIRNIIGQSQRALDFAQIMAEGKILLVNLSSGGKISYENAQLLGIMLVNEIFRVAKLRDPRDPKLKPFYFYIDEFGQFVTRDIARALEECRKYKLYLLLAHQHLAQLKKEDEYLYASVLTNCKNKVVFGGLSQEDVQVMADEIVTGFVNLKSIKDEMYRTAHRYREETRVSVSTSNATTEGSSESSTTTRGASKGESSGMSRGTSRGHTDTHGQSSGQGWNESQGESAGRGRSKGRSDGQSVNEGHSTGWNDTESEGWGRAENESRSRGASWGRNVSDTQGSGRGVSRSDSYGTTKGVNHSESSGFSEGTNESESKGLSRGRTWSDSFGTSESLSEGETHGNTNTRGQSHARGTMESTSDSFGRTRGESSGMNYRDGNDRYAYQRGESDSRTENHGTTRGRSETFTDTESQSESHSTSISRTRGENRSHSDGGNEGENSSRSFGKNRNETMNRSQGSSAGESYSRSGGSNESWNESHSQGQSYGEQEGRSKGSSRSQSGSHSKGRNASQSRGTSTSRNETESESETNSHSFQRGMSGNETVSQSRADSRQESQSESQSRSSTRSQSTGKTRGTNESRTIGETRSEQTVFVPYEVEELTSRTFWTKDELHYMEAATMKNQSTGQAFIKVAHNRPVQIQVEYVKSAPYSPRLTPKRIEAFKQKVFEKNAEFYTPTAEVRREAMERQRAIFGEPLRFDEAPLLPRGDVAPEAIEIEGRVLSHEERRSRDEQDPFAS